MVSIQDELSMHEVVAPVLNRLDDGVKLDVISTVSTTRTSKLFAIVSDRVPLLAQHCSNAEFGCITVQLESSLKVG